MSARSQPRIAVIGVGVIGAAIADALAQRRAVVTLFDMRAPGQGASQASAGVLSPFIEARPGSPLLALGRRSLAMWDEFAQTLAQRVPSSPFHYARTGTLEVALDAERADHLAMVARWLRDEGVEHEWLTVPALRELEPAITPTAIGGLLIARHGVVQVSPLIAAMLQSARLAGTTLVTPTEILRVDPRRDSVLVRVGEVATSFDHVVVCAGSWSGRVRVAGVPALPVRPIRGQLLRLQTQGAPLIRRSVWGPGCYTVPWPDGSLLVGATVEDVGFDERSTVSGVQDLLAAVTTVLPASHGAAVEEVKVGLRPATADHLPLLGPLDAHPRVVVATGHYRNGVLLAPLTAGIVTSYLLDGTQDVGFAQTSPDRFSTATTADAVSDDPSHA